MGQILHNWRLLAATLFSFALVFGAYALGKGIHAPPVAQASVEAALLEGIAARDTDGDGLPDWEESLYGSDPRVADTFGLGMTDAAAVSKGLVIPKAIASISETAPAAPLPDEHGLPPAPASGTLTAVFTQHFLDLYVAARQAKNGEDLTETERRSIALTAVDSLGSVIDLTPDFTSVRDLTIVGGGVSALKTFAADAEAVFARNVAADATEVEFVYLKEALEKDSEIPLQRIASLAKSYRDSAVGLSELAIPSDVASDVAAFINALMRQSEAASDLVKLYADPLATVLALEQYPHILESLRQALLRVGEAYARAKVTLPAGEPGSYFVRLIQETAALQL